MVMNKTVLLRQNGDDVEATEVSTFDMGGYFPVKLMNMVMAGSIKAVMPKMTKQMMDFKEKFLKGEVEKP